MEEERGVGGHFLACLRAFALKHNGRGDGERGHRQGGGIMPSSSSSSSFPMNALKRLNASLLTQTAIYYYYYRYQDTYERRLENGELTSVFLLGAEKKAKYWQPTTKEEEAPLTEEVN